MAGGDGKRLKAVSGETPKPMVMLCGRPVMEHIVMLLKKHGITDICVALRYRPEVIKEYFDDGSKWGVSMSYSVEEASLGTAGAVKACADFYGDEDFLVISGDAICDFDLSALISAHEKKHSAVTLALYPHPEPLRYGLCLCDRESCVHTFIEKPDWSHVVTNLVNTGVYVVSPEAMKLVPENEEYDFAKDLFPELLKRGEKLLGVPCDGYWCDIGTPRSYYECCADVLSGRVDLQLDRGFERVTQENTQDNTESFMSSETVTCRDRARLMDRISASFLELGADAADGLCLHGEGYEIHFHAMPDTAAVSVAANASDTELAHELVLSAAELIKEMEKRLD